MTKHPYQTCLRMPLTLKEDMTTICDQFQINESDLMRLTCPPKTSPARMLGSGWLGGGQDGEEKSHG